MRQHLVRLLEDEASPPLSARGRDVPPRLSVRGRGAASSSSVGTKQRLILPLEDETSPRLTAQGRGAASSFRVGDELGDEAWSRLPAQGRSSASFSHWNTRRRLVFPRGDEAPLCFSREARLCL
ncbi:hypothetical protein B296_00033187, partial [Ensete ventricosum]